MKRSLSLIFLVVFLRLSSFSQVLINEVCPANANINFDTKFYNFSPWVELYNAGNASVSLGGYYLTDDAAAKTKWRIPNGTTIASKGYLLIWCNGKNQNLYTNFSLDAEGGEVVLSNASLTQLDKVQYSTQYTNVSYGRVGDGNSTWGYLITPTPSAGNATSAASTRLENPTVSLKSGRYSGAQTATLSHNTSGVQIRYTIDGSEPSAASTLYANPIAISKTITLKAKAYLDGNIPSKTEVKTYFVNERAFSLPVVSITTDPKFLDDNTIGIYTAGTNGIDGYCQGEKRNWNQDWERHAVFELFDATGEKRFDQSVDLRIGGNCSRALPQKSLVLKARDKYGRNTINEKLFPKKPSSRYGGFIFRNSGNDFYNTMFRDAFMHQLVAGQMDVDYLEYEPAIFYLNGKYWGIQNMREKIDADYIESNYGIRKNDLDLVENTWNTLEGSNAGFLSYLNTLEQSNNLSTAEAFTYIDQNIDVQEFINYLTAEIYYCNTDWPGNNMKFWRQRSTNGKWRWILWDLDFGFGLYTDMSHAAHPTLNFATDPNSGVGWPNPPWSTLHLRLLLQNPTFKTKFIQTLTSSLNTTFKPERVIKFVDAFQNRLQTEMPFHLQRWGMNMPGWNSEVQRLRDFAIQRNAYMKDHIASFFGLNASDNVRISVSSTPAVAGTYRLNGIKGDEALVNGFYYKGLSYEVEPAAVSGYQFKEWKVTKRESINHALVGLQSSWKYFDQGFLPSASWNSTSFNDVAWSSGNAQLGYGEGDEQTTISYGPDANNKHITAYFRKSFVVNDKSVLTDISARAIYDDGIVVYLNGQEVFRGNMPAGAVVFNTLALEAAVENVYVPFTIPASMLVNGTNVIAVEVHQNGPTSSDLSFDLELNSWQIGDEVSFTTTAPVVADVANSDIILEAVYIPVQPVSGIVINEFSASNTVVKDNAGQAEDWIELYNNATTAINLAGLYISDNVNNRTKYQLPANKAAETTINPGEYKIVYADEDLHQGPLHVNFKLSADGEAIGIYQKVGESILTLDEVVYAAHATDLSYSRIPNITGPFVLTAKQTPLAPNVYEEPKVVTGIRVDDEEDLSLFPNPVAKSFVVAGTSPNTTISIYTSSGVLIRAVRNYDGGAIDLSNTPAGLYMVTIASKGKIIARRLIRQ